MTQSFVAPQVELVSVSKSYGNGSLVVDGLNLTVAKGEFVTLLGSSGCGKSTVLKLISGLTPATSGTITVDGMTPQNARGTVSYIFQDSTLLPWRTVRQNVGLGLELEGINGDQRKKKAESLLDLVGLRHVAEAYPRELSGGMKMRVSIARALATSPRLLLMDEPFAALDEMTRDRMNEEIMRMREEQKWTAVFVTHSVAEAVFLSTRIVILSRMPGRIHTIVAVDLPSPRTGALRASPSFGELVLQVSRTLREATLG